MTSKSLSTGTLSLRFMQNAHRAKQLKEVELDRAEVKDDGMWEVSQAVRDAWGLQRDIEDSSSNDVHESSYLPFIFSAIDSVEADDGVPAASSTRKVATGRRTFNNSGEEVSQSTSTRLELQEGSSSTGTPASACAAESSSTRKIHPRPISISASGTSGQLKGFEQLQKPKESKTARQTIFENGGVGTDLRAPSRKNAVASTSATFMKPAGIDDPRTASDSVLLPIASRGIIESTRRKQTKRERDPSGDEPKSTKKKPKKQGSE